MSRTKSTTEVELVFRDYNKYMVGTGCMFYELSRRWAMACNIWVGIHPPERKQQASEQFKQLCHHAVAWGGLFKLLAAGVNGEYDWPPMMQENISLWERLLRYVAYGNPEVEILVSTKYPDYVRRSVEFAKSEIVNELKYEYSLILPISEAELIP